MEIGQKSKMLTNGGCRQHEDKNGGRILENWRKVRINGSKYVIIEIHRNLFHKRAKIQRK